MQKDAILTVADLRPLIRESFVHDPIIIPEYYYCSQTRTAGCEVLVGFVSKRERLHRLHSNSSQTLTTVAFRHQKGKYVR